MKQKLIYSWILSVFLLFPISFSWKSNPHSFLAPESHFSDIFEAEDLGLEGMVMIFLTMSEMREEVLEDLIDYGSEVERVVPALANALKIDDDDLHMELLYLFSELGSVAVAAVPNLIQFIKKNSGKKMEQAIKVLAKIGRADPDTVPLLVREMKPPSKQSFTFEDAISSNSINFRPRSVIIKKRKDLRLARLMMWTLIYLGTKESLEAAQENVWSFDYRPSDRNSFLSAIGKKKKRLAQKSQNEVPVFHSQSIDFAL